MGGKEVYLSSFWCVCGWVPKLWGSFACEKTFPMLFYASFATAETCAIRDASGFGMFNAM